MKKIVIASLLISAMFVTTDLFAVEDAARQIVVNMKVTKGTPDGATTVDDLAAITLYENGQEVETYTSTVGDDGNAHFEYPAIDGHFMLLPRVRHQNLMFSGPMVHAVNSPAPIDVTVEVYDVIADNSGIAVGSHQIILKAIGKNILVTEFVQLKNSTNNALTSAQKDENDHAIVLSFSLPAGHKEFTVSKYFVADALGFTEDGFYDTMAIPPGTYDAMFTYLLPITSEEMSITKKITMPTDDVMVFSQLKSGQVQGLGNPAGQLTMEDGSPAEYFSLGNKKNEDQIAITIAGLETGSSMTMMIIIAVAFLLIAPLVLVRFKPAK